MHKSHEQGSLKVRLACAKEAVGLECDSPPSLPPPPAITCLLEICNLTILCGYSPFFFHTILKLQNLNHLEDLLQPDCCAGQNP